MANSTREHFKNRRKELATSFTEGSAAIARGAKGRFLKSDRGQRARDSLAKARGKAYTAQDKLTAAQHAMQGTTTRLAALTSALSKSAGGFAHSVGANVRGQLPHFGPRQGFEVRASQWQAALMLPFLVVVMMAVVTVVYQATIQVVVSLGLTNVAFLWFTQTIMGLGLLLVGVFGLVKWVESGGFGIFRWS
jgi:hypothetical protein